MKRLTASVSLFIANVVNGILIGLYIYWNNVFRDTSFKNTIHNIIGITFPKVYNKKNKEYGYRFYLLVFVININSHEIFPKNILDKINIKNDSRQSLELNIGISLNLFRGRRGRDRMVVGLTTTHAISVYHH